MTDQYDQTAAGERYLIQSNALSAWFMGPRAENHGLFNKLMDQTIQQHQANRRKYWPTDPEYVTKLQKCTPAYRSEKRQLKQKLKEMNDDLEQSTPVFSPRFQGHMNWDISMPAVLGYISGMVWNPNNVDVTASPITTPYEIIAADQICDMIGFDRSLPDYQPWGHITCGGSIANIEAVWSSRNMKFYPLSLQDAVMAEPDLAGAKTYMVNVPENPEPKPDGGAGYKDVELQNCSVWQLLNLDVDEACKMAQGVAEKAGVSMDKLSELVHPYAYTSVGISTFLTKHSIKSPRLFVPATCHYSWPKAATVLGLGEDNLIHINVTSEARQDMNHLREQLQDCVDNGIPVISVTAVIGSTEESAMDPLTEMLVMRDEFKKKGLNYAMLADAAWGAYMRTMLIDPDENVELERLHVKKGKKGRKHRSRKVDILSKYVPITPLSKHATDQLNALRHADTVTSDPHKTGYCPYPAGGLSYRNGTMKDFVLLAAPEVFHAEDDLSVGVNGLEGSKPGAAGAGVLLSHRVIGLDKYGYGRILGQSVYGSKIYYCMWLHLSKPTDPFVIKPYLPCPPGDTALAKQLIIGKSNLEIVQSKDAMSLLERVGPDCMINKFGVNLKLSDGSLNPDVDISTEYSKKIGQLLSVNADKDNHRVPLVIFQSMMEPGTFGQSLKDFEKTIGLTINNDNQFGCMVNTVMNPWQASAEFCWRVGEIYREACLLAHGWQTDDPAKHLFVCGELQDSAEHGAFMYVNLVGKFESKTEQYECIVKLGVINDADEIRIKELAQNGRLYIKNKNPQVLYQMLLDAGDEKGTEFEFNHVYTTGMPLFTASLRVIDTPRVKHYDTPTDPDLDYPDFHTYFMYGEGGKVYLSHMLTKNPDFQQFLEVESTDMSGDADQWLLWYGFPVTFVDLPVDKANPQANPLTREDRTYNIKFAGEKHKPREMAIVLINNTGWFDNTILNTVNA